MSLLPAPLVRALSLLVIGSAIAVGHIAFAAAQAKPTDLTSVASSVPMEAKVADVDSTSSVSPRQELAENCYIDMQVVKGIRGKTIVTRVHECD